MKNWRMAEVKQKKMYIEVDTGAAAKPVWIKVGWEIQYIEFRDNGEILIEFDPLIAEGHAGLAKITKCFWDRKDIHLRINGPAKTRIDNFNVLSLSAEEVLFAFAVPEE